MILFIFKENDTSLNTTFAIFLILLTVSFNQSLLSIGSDYIQGTDGPFNLNIIVNLLNEYGKFNLYNENSLFNLNFYGLPIFCNIVSILLNLPLDFVCLHSNPIFGVISIFIYFVLIKDQLPIKLALISTIFLGWSLTYIIYGIELRPENLGFLFFIMVFYFVSKKTMLSHVNYLFSLLAILVSFALVTTHGAATIHSVLIFTIFSFNISYLSKKRCKQYNEQIHVIIFVIFIFYLFYLTGSSTSFLNILYRSIEGAFSIDQNLIFNEKGVSALSNNIPFIITILVWIERTLFIIGYIFLSYNIYIKNSQYLNSFYLFILLWSSVYFVIIILSIPAHTLNPSRIYRFFEIPVSIIKSIILIHTITLIPYNLHRNIAINSFRVFPSFLKIPLSKFISVMFSRTIRIGLASTIMLLIMINSIFLLPMWVINIELNSYHEEPYADFCDQDILAGKFASAKLNNFVFIGDFRTKVIFGIIGNKKIIKIDSINVNFEPPNLFEKSIFIGLKTGDKQNIYLTEDFINAGFKIYDNRRVNINLLHRECGGSRIPRP
ncbi:hypothetical protein [Methanosarcina sp. WH1]|uniref:hypothetical protein n=1 Tax=Methanosarcina sp. WH1 TaxID=1434102 RepID=UPI0012E02F3A|nr:hypothetical protein [Methanosarcina sp. WH1]